MAFFARPNLDNTQFKQLEGSELTLSGQTQIATTSGLTLTDGVGGYIPIHVTGATSLDVLTYKDGVIKLFPSSASGATGFYDGASPSTVSVGGLPDGSPISGCSVNCILEDILVPTLDPILTNPSISSFTIAPSTLLYEVGTSISLTMTTNFDAGSINPQYTSASECRSDGASGYCYNIFGTPLYKLCSLPTASEATGANIVTSGNNTLSVNIYYSGGTQPKNSSGGNFSTPLSAGNTGTSSKTIIGTYPWYWGIKASSGAAAGANRPTACYIKDVITGGTIVGGTCAKVVGLSMGTIYTTFNSTTDDYLWFATPAACTTKTCWYVDALNNNPIGGAVSPGGELFPDPETVTNVTTTYWSGESYKIYISNYQSAATLNMQLRNN